MPSLHSLQTVARAARRPATKSASVPPRPKRRAPASPPWDAAATSTPAPTASVDPDPGAPPGRLRVDYRALSQLIPYARNARTHSDEQIAQIAGSIREFGWTVPILVDGQNGIIAGHARVLAGATLGFTHAPVIELAHLTDAQRRAYILADNKLALNAGWDEALLKLELADLQELGANLGLTGFSADELAHLQTMFDPDTGEQSVLDQTAPPEQIECPKCGHTFER